MRYALGIDIGTTSVKCVLLSQAGEVAGEATVPHDLVCRHPGWAEEDAAVWWDHTQLALSQLKEKLPQAMAKVAAIGVSGMVPAIVLLDKEGRPLRATIQQNDARAAPQMEALKELLDQDELFARTGTRTNLQHVLPRLLWVRQNEPAVFAGAACVLGSYEYITYCLTGHKYIECNWAAESGMYDIQKRRWLKAQFDLLGAPDGFFSPVMESGDIAGHLTAEAAARFGLPARTPVIAGSADHVASTLAAGITRQGDLLIKFGGAGDILYCTDTPQTDDRLFFDYHVVPGKYLLNGCMAASGSLVKWFVKDILGDDDPAALRLLDRQSMEIPPASDGLVILPYFLGEKTPIFDPEARGVMCGLTLSHGRAHIFRAILESVIYGFKHHIEVLAEGGFYPQRIFASDGGAKSEFWCQIAADVLNAPVTSFAHHPGSAYGAAFLAGVAACLFDSFERVRDFVEDGAKTYSPNAQNAVVYERAYRVYRELYMRLRGPFGEIARFYRE
ncbi:MAG TPA: FGGY-family carbohydrate kinase [Terriglobales bacterium]|nr:FGGY-family carbohydrate kinase [Terriglobales bacterium]